MTKITDEERIALWILNRAFDYLQPRMTPFAAVPPNPEAQAGSILARAMNRVVFQI